MRTKPECRYCGTRVEHFGDLCESCGSDRTESSDAMSDAARWDSYAMQQSMAAEDY